MLSELTETAADYCSYYSVALSHAWKCITPVQYVGLLVGVLVVGWLMMKNGAR